MACNSKHWFLALASMGKLCPAGIGSNMPSGSRFALPVSASLDQWLIEAGVPRCQRQAHRANPKHTGAFQASSPLVSFSIAVAKASPLAKLGIKDKTRRDTVNSRCCIEWKKKALHHR